MSLPTPDSDPTLVARVAQLERANRRLSAVVTALGAGLLAVMAAACLGNRAAGAAGVASAPGPLAASVLRASAVEVVDDRGVVRLRLAGVLPDPVIGGERRNRGDVAAGVILYDSTGQERGGYVTFDHSGQVALTLDGRRAQSALFVADTTGSAALRIWRGDAAAELRVDRDGARFGAQRKGQLVFQAPEMEHPERSATCTDLRALRDQAPADKLLDACRQRMSEGACRLCLGTP